MIMRRIHNHIDVRWWLVVIRYSLSQDVITKQVVQFYPLALHSKCELTTETAVNNPNKAATSPQAKQK